MTALRLALAFCSVCALMAQAESPRAERLQRAKAGDAVAMRELAEDLIAGRDGRRDAKAAQRWARAAIDHGDVPAELVLGRILGETADGPTSARSCFWFHSAFHQGSELGILQVADCLAVQTRGVAADDRVQALYERALELGHAEARMRLYRYFNRRGVGSDELRERYAALARRYLLAAALSGDIEAMRILAVTLRDAEPPARDLVGAVNWFSRGQDAGDPEATLPLAVLLYEGEGVSDPARAIPLFELAAARGSAVAMRYLGKAHAAGRGVARDPVAAQRWFLQGGRGDDGEAALARARFHLDVNSGQHSFRRARYWLEIATRGGAPGAARRLGLMHLRGEGVPTDVNKGLRFLEAAANKDDAEAARALIRVYLDGQFVRRDAATAIRIARARRDELDGASLARIGRLYLGDKDVGRDLEVAREWLTRAAVKGDVGAMAALVPLLRDGRGGPPDAEAAALWSAKARELGAVDVPSPGRPIDRIAARRQGRSLAHFEWNPYLAWGAGDALAIRSLPSRGALRSEFRIADLDDRRQRPGEAGFALLDAVGQRVNLFLRAHPRSTVGSAQIQRLELVLEFRAGVEVVQTQVLWTGVLAPWGGASTWVELAWDEQGAIAIRVDDAEPIRMARPDFRVDRALVFADNCDARFNYVAVD